MKNNSYITDTEIDEILLAICEREYREADKETFWAEEMRSAIEFYKQLLNKNLIKGKGEEK
jgi:hypothetical protein